VFALRKSLVAVGGNPPTAVVSHDVGRPRNDLQFWSALSMMGKRAGWSHSIYGDWSVVGASH